MRVLLATTALSGIAVALSPTAARAEKVISTAVTSPVTTSGEDVRITSAGSVKPTSGVAVTINSNNGVKNEGTIAIQGANDSAGIVANANVTGGITNSGTITIDENYTATDSDKDGDLDGPFAQGSNRYGIRVASGGTFTGSILNSGTIAVEGNQSAGIAIDSTLNGTLTNSGDISVVGNDTFGIRTGAVTGNIAINGGNITAQGENAVAVMIGGDVGGSVVLKGTIGSTGYRYLTPPADVSKLDSDDLLQGGSAVVIAGDVVGGIEASATVNTFGSAAAFSIGSSSESITIGGFGSTGHGLVAKGKITGSGTYDGVSATGIAIGGLGQTVSITGGATISGSVAATAKKANATALHIGSGASVPTLVVSGSVKATGGGTDATAAQAILIDAGATVNTIQNSGTIEGALAGDAGSASAIVDKSGTLTLIENSGSIGVADASKLDVATAIDLRANTSGATIKQVAAPTGKPAPRINGDVLLGSGNDVLQILAGSLVGNVDFGGGTDVLALGGLFRGELHNSAGAAVTVGTGGLLDVKNLGTVELGSLTTNSGGAIGVTIGESAHTLYNVTGTATFGTGSKVVVTLDRLGTASGSYKIIDAGTLVGGSNLTGSIVTLPFLFNSSLTASDASGEVMLEIELKSDSELGLNGSEIAILDAALEAADGDEPMAAVFLTTADSASLKATLQQLLPEHAGGTFETATKGSRLMARILGDPGAEVSDMGGWGLWHEQVAWGTSKSIGSTSSYKLGGWGAALGGEVSVGTLGNVGVSAAYLTGRDGWGNNELLSSQYEGGLYWRGGTGPLRGFARATAAWINFDGNRRFSATVNGSPVTREAKGEWNGTLYSGIAGAFYDARFGRVSLRPLVSLEHFKLKEKGYAETGGGEGFDLIVDGRSSNETSANALLSLGYELLSTDHSGPWLRLEIEGGRREILSGRLGTTTARFQDGDPFTLVAEERTSGWVAGIRAIGGGAGISAGAEINAEEQQGNASVGGRFSVYVPF